MAKRVISAVLTLKDKDFSSGVKKASKNMTDFDRRVQRTKNQVNEFGAKSVAQLKNVGLAAGALGAAALTGFGVALTSTVKEMDTAFSMLEARTGATGEELKELEGVAKEVFKAGFGESISTVANDVAMLNSMFSDLSDEQLTEVAKGASTISELWGADMKEVGRAVQGMVNNFDGLSETQALDLMTTAFQKTGDYSNDLLDTFNEYSVHFANLGLSAEEFTGILINGAQAGAFNMDKVGDAVKEFGIRAIDGSKGTVEGFAAIGLSADEMAKKIGEGGESAQQAFMATIAGLAAMEDPIKRNEAGVALFGTMWEDLRDDVILSMSDGASAVEGFEGATSRAAEAMQNNFSAKLDKVWRNMKIGMADAFEGAGGAELLDTLAKKAEEFIPVIEDMVEGAINFAKSVKDNWPVIKEVLVGVGTFAGVLGTVKLGIMGIATAQTVWNAAMRMNPIGLIVTGIAALIGIGVLLYRNWDTVKEKAIDLWSKIRENPITAFLTQPIQNAIDAGVWLYKNWDTVKEKAGQLWNTTKEVFGNMFDWASKKIEPIVGFFKGLYDRFIDFKNAISNFKPPEWVSSIGGAIGKGINWVTNKINGSHATGLNKVPFDGYIAELHKGEMVIPSRQAERLRNAGLNVNNVDKPIVNRNNTTNVNRQTTNTVTTEQVDNSRSVVIQNLIVNAKGVTADEVIGELVPQLKLALQNM